MKLALPFRIDDIQSHLNRPPVSLIMCRKRDRIIESLFSELWFVVSRKMDRTWSSTLIGELMK